MRTDRACSHSSQVSLALFHTRNVGLNEKKQYRVIAGSERNKSAWSRIEGRIAARRSPLSVRTSSRESFATLSLLRELPHVDCSVLARALHNAASYGVKSPFTWLSSNIPNHRKKCSAVCVSNRPQGMYCSSQALLIKIWYFDIIRSPVTRGM